MTRRDRALHVLRLWAATGDAIARLDEADGGWDVSVSLEGSGAQCLAVDPSDPDTAFAGLREHGLRRTRDAGETWEDVELPEPGVFSLAVSAADGAVYAGCEPSRALPQRRRRRLVARARRAARASLAPDLELPAEALDVARPLDRAEPARRRSPARRDRARRPHALDRRRRDAGRTTGRARSPTSTRSPGTRGSRAARTRRVAADPPGVTTAARPGTRPTTAATGTTRGRWRPIRPIPTSGS